MLMNSSREILRYNHPWIPFSPPVLNTEPKIEIYVQIKVKILGRQKDKNITERRES